MIDVHKFVNTLPIRSVMMGKNQIVGVLEHLQQVLLADVPGAVVELGCYSGTTSIFIRKFLDEFGSNKEYHVYDSWQGLPDKHPKDGGPKAGRFKKGSCAISKKHFEQTFKLVKLAEPVIHTGWFGQIPDNEYPEQICFAFFDGDFYTSIMDSFKKVYPKMSPGGIIIIDDCGWDVLPGVEKACRDFLADKPETLDLTGYPDEQYVYGKVKGGGKVVKS